MNTQFRQTDAQILNNIIEYANQRYMRQSRLHKTSSFNILRILSAFKQTQQNFEYRKDHIYNWIIYITKNYNPQTVKQWINAINQLSCNCNNQNNQNMTIVEGNNEKYVSRKVSRCQRSQKSLYFCTNQGRLGVSFDQNVKAWNHSMYEPVSSQNSVNYQRKKSKQIISSSDSQFNFLAPISSKMHYISFEPDNQNKQNINSANTHSEHLKSDNLRCDNQPTRTPGEQSFIHNLPMTRTPGEQSFIHNLPMSYGSPFVLSKITNNTKQVTEVQDEQQHTQEWNNMKARADIFHRINLSMKSFSALMANFQAFGIFQEIYKKTKKFQKKLRFYRFYKAGVSYLNMKKQKSNCNEITAQHYERNLTKKALKILKVYYQLKINKQNKKTKNINNFNSTSFEFLITLIFSPTQDQQNDCLNHDTPKSLRHKSKYFQNIEDCEKMQLISEYFSCNFRLNKQQIQTLFELYKQSRKLKAFKILKNSVRKFEKQSEQLIAYRKKEYLKYFISYNKRKFNNEASIKIMNLSKQRELKQKCFKAIHEFQLSKKIYIKRQEYLKNQHRLSIMKQLLKEWKNRKNQVVAKKLGYKEFVNKGCEAVLKIMKKKHLQQFIDICENLRIMKVQQQRLMDRQICKQIFQHLKAKTRERKSYNFIKDKHQNSLKQQSLKIWIKSTKLSLLTKKIQLIFQAKGFNHMKKQFSVNKGYEIIKLVREKQMQKEVFKHLRISFNLDREQQNRKIKKCESVVLKQEGQIFLKICQIQLNKVKQLKYKKQVAQKQNSLTKYLQLKLKKSVIGCLSDARSCKKSLCNKQQIIKSVMGQRMIKIESKQIKNGQQQEKIQTLTRCHLKMKRQVILFLKNQHRIAQSTQYLQNMLRQTKIKFLAQRFLEWKKITSLKMKQKELISKKNENLSKTAFKSLKQVYNLHSNKMKVAQSKHSKSLKYKSVLGLAKAIMFTLSLVRNLQKTLISNRKTRQTKFLLRRLRTKIDISKKTNTLQKTRFVNRLNRNAKNNENIKQKETNLQIMIKEANLNRFLSSKVHKFEKQIKRQNIEQAYKRFAVMKVQRAVIRYILSRKYYYMAIKFKAINLCRQAFTALQRNRTITRYSLQNSKKMRIHEHISTSYSSL